MIKFDIFDNIRKLDPKFYENHMLFIFLNFRLYWIPETFFGSFALLPSLIAWLILPLSIVSVARFLNSPFSIPPLWELNSPPHVTPSLAPSLAHLVSGSLFTLMVMLFTFFFSNFSATLADPLQYLSMLWKNQLYLDVNQV